MKTTTRWISLLLGLSLLFLFAAPLGTVHAEPDVVITLGSDEDLTVLLSPNNNALQIRWIGSDYYIKDTGDTVSVTTQPGSGISSSILSPNEVRVSGFTSFTINGATAADSITITPPGGAGEKLIATPLGPGLLRIARDKNTPARFEEILKINGTAPVTLVGNPNDSDPVSIGGTRGDDTITYTMDYPAGNGVFQIVTAAGTDGGFNSSFTVNVLNAEPTTQMHIMRYDYNYPFTPGQIDNYFGFDQFHLIATGLDDEIIYTGGGFFSGNTTVRHGNTQLVSFDTYGEGNRGVDRIWIDAMGGSDHISVKPNNKTEINVYGGDPIPPGNPGDTLTVIPSPMPSFPGYSDIDFAHLHSSYTASGYEGLFEYHIPNAVETRGDINFWQIEVIEPSATVSGRVYHDLDADGLRDVADEPGIQGWTLQLFMIGGTVPVATTTTAADGTYSFPNLQNGTYQVAQVLQTGWIRTSTPEVYTFTVSDLDQLFGAKDFGNVLPANASISGTYSPDLIVTGQPVTFNVTVGNSGPNVASNMVLLLSVPANGAFTSLSVPSGWNCPGLPSPGTIGPVIACNRSSQPVSENSVFTLVAVAGPVDLTSYLRAEVITSTYEAVTSNNQLVLYYSQDRSMYLPFVKK